MADFANQLGTIVPGKRSMAYELDSVDISLIALLQENGRQSTTEISRLISIPASTVRRRIDRLLREQVIQVVAVVQAPEMLELPVHANLFLGVAPVDEKGVIAELSECVEIRWIAHTTGPLSIQAEGFFHSLDHLGQFYDKHVRTIPGVRESRFDIILDLHKNRFDWAAMAGAKH